MKSSFIKKADIALAIVLLIAGLGSMFLVRRPAAESGMVEINVAGKVVKTLPLSKDCSFEVSNEYGSNTIVIENGAVYVSESDCHGKDCKAIGKISSEGQLILCLPHRLMIKIAGGGEVDASV